MGSLTSWSTNALKRKPKDKWNVSNVLDPFVLVILMEDAKDSLEPLWQALISTIFRATDDVNSLREAVWRHKVIIVKGQHNLDPKNQWDLIRRLDPETKDEGKSLNDHRNGLLFRARCFPGAGNVRLFGKGFQGEDHYGMKNRTITRWLNHDWHVSPPPKEAFESGITRFQRWHFDAPLYGDEPTWFTCLWIAKQPSGPDLTVEWADGSGLTMETPPGLTAFFSSVQLYDMLSQDEKELVDHSWVEYAPHPFKWIHECKSRNTGLGIADGGHLTEEELGEYDPAAVKKYPMVWVNPRTGDKAFQVHGICVRRLYLRSSTNEQPRVVEDITEIHDFILGIQHRILKPEYILLAPAEEGDMVIWDNYSLFHTAIDYPEKYGPRSMHKADTGGSIGPKGPVPIGI
ncbi:TauD/TfdA dioxygenase family protein [Aspergillus alliaceus]|uniref:TauD/TfdA dioxygenase family protein n=1 Tax=Petromyces alliaceus TaxID=209559 RepID=UPI0012A5BDB9|nr:uncharacterized protein BDW43DRAFT_311437 [Aspergillus alliaceus]KAB8233026.1 hypothetical protein BDW43DRAFT_311437 [Aspergillus alliaceus]